MQDTHHQINNNILRGGNCKQSASSGRCPSAVPLDDKGCPEDKDRAGDETLARRALEQILGLELDKAEPSPGPAPP